jgi:hypothetical protein
LRKLIAILLLLLSSVGVAAQQHDDKDRQPVQSFSTGLYAHTYGAGLEFQTVRLRESTDWVISLGFGSYKLAKEYKIESLYKDQGGEDLYDGRNLEGGF